MMTTLVFRALDRHVVGGLADHPAIVDDQGPLSYAQLLHESASIAGALSHLGVERGSHVAIDLPQGRELVIAVLACVRLGAVPATAGLFSLAGDPPVLTTPDTEVTWELLVRAGRAEPAPAPDSDPEGYEAIVIDQHGELFEILIAGATI
ncbi:MAG: AMP-binding protein [Aeromicrobium sp.]